MAMTVKGLRTRLDKLIKDGHGAKKVMINKKTFQHNLEPDGCVILPIESMGVLTYNILDDDGGHGENKDGSEKLETGLVFYGDGRETH